MSFKSNLEEDLSIFFNVDEFADTVTFDSGSFLAVLLTQQGFDGIDTILTCKSVDVALLAVGTIVTINENSYKVLNKSIQEDGLTDVSIN